MADLKTSRRRATIWTMVITLLIIAACGFAFGTVVETTLVEEIAKWVIGGIGVSCITGLFAYILAPIFWLSKHGEEEE